MPRINILSNDEIVAASNVLRDVKIFKEMIETAVNTIRYAIDYPDINTWVQKSPNGANIINRINNNNETLTKITHQLDGIYEVTSRYLTNMSIANSEGGY